MNVVRTAALTLAGLVLAGVALTGCGKSAPKSAPPPSSPPSSSSAGSSSATARPTATAAPTLGGECADLLPVSAVEDALGRPVFGQTAFVRGVAEADIGRLTYLNCRYGLAAPVRGKPAPQPQLEVGISLYNSSAQASKRVQGTVEDFRDARGAPAGRRGGQ